MQTFFDKVQAFNIKFDLPAASKPEALELYEFKYRVDHIMEEITEMYIAHQDDNLEGQLDGLVDLVYVAMGLAHRMGFDFNEAFERVHQANMLKVRATTPEQSKRGTTLDVIKPKGWVAPDLSDLVV